jgi:hypothetical protein
MKFGLQAECSNCDIFRLTAKLHATLLIALLVDHREALINNCCASCATAATVTRVMQR